MKKNAEIWKCGKGMMDIQSSDLGDQESGVHKIKCAHEFVGIVQGNSSWDSQEGNQQHWVVVHDGGVVVLE